MAVEHTAACERRTTSTAGRGRTSTSASTRASPDHDYLRRLLLVRLLHVSIGLPGKNLSVEIAKIMERMGMRSTLDPADVPCFVRR